ncbi:hypothetical protein BGZ99_002454 [Dissophora globulifera]|uniref:Swi5-dependent recombination DNA repair protein 1 n=1 Tax=Dissophora globulifera TaxID=979702 RepID=A0A9P6RSG1_9FUNG|nr:hypothetical protein BGZ99_002454 [Dissophora globulifera]
MDDLIPVSEQLSAEFRAIDRSPDLKVSLESTQFGSDAREADTVVELSRSSLNTETPPSPPRQPSGMLLNESSGARFAVPLVKRSGQKRMNDSMQTRGSIHKPFRSPMRISNISAPEQTGSIKGSSTSISQGRAATTAGTSGGGSSMEDSQVTVSDVAPPPPLRPPAHRYPGTTSSSRVSSLSSKLHTTAAGARRPFRSPVMALADQTKQPSSISNRSSAYGRLIEMQALQSRVAELQSSIRKGRQVLQQQERTDTPLEDLINKWRNASQEGARVLLEKFIEQEQAFGVGDSALRDTGSASSMGSKTNHGFYSGFDDSWGYTADTLSGRRGQYLSELNQEEMEAMVERMESQDVQDDLPTVDEAIRSKTLPNGEAKVPRALTKMQRLLTGLGIDPAVIGYDVEQDAFTSEELTYDTNF